MGQTRRDFLIRSGILGCSLAASPLVTPVTWASAPWDTRLVVIILRGGMDGLDVVRPLGDPAFAALRPGMGVDTSLDLDGYFGLHPALAPLIPWWDRGDLGFVHAVSTPYRDKRSHFDGQDLLEAGTDVLGGAVRDGWLNRMLQEVPGVAAETAYAIGAGDLRVLNGAAPVANWTPQAKLRLSPQAMRLADLVMEEDPALHAALSEAQMLSESTGEREKGRPHEQIAKFAASRLTGAARVAAFSLGGWDTHRAQHKALPRTLERFAQTLIALRDALPDPVWDKTAVVAMTEFGRTARQNGTDGTDHGTAGLMVLAGGAVRGGRVYGQWPGLADGQLYQERDLMPTGDVRAAAGWVMRGLMGLPKGTVQRSIFPGVEMGDDPGLLK